MLIEFRVKNFRSIRDETVFSMVASKDKLLEKSHLLETGIKAIPKVVKSSGVYGANASGKSTLFYAINYFRNVVAESASLQPDHKFNVKPFVLDSETSKEPSEFEITFLHEGVRYQYGYTMIPERIMEEWLFVYKTAKPTHLFSRIFNGSKKEYEYEFGPSLSGKKSTWKESTRSNSLFLSMAVQLNSEQLRTVYTWIMQNLVFIGAQGMPFNEFSTQMLESDGGKAAIKDFLASADISIDKIDLVSKKVRDNTVHVNVVTGETNTVTEENERKFPVFHHKTDRGSAVFELNEESSGTQRLFALAGPFIDILTRGKVLIFDELDSSLHTFLAKRLVELFHNNEINSRGAQLVFTTHDTALLQDNLLRRDQVWFIEKDQDQSSHLYPLTDFSPRKKESIERGYKLGRYGAVPVFQDALKSAG